MDKRECLIGYFAFHYRLRFCVKCMLLISVNVNVIFPVMVFRSSWGSMGVRVCQLIGIKKFTSSFSAMLSFRDKYTRQTSITTVTTLPQSLALLVKIRTITRASWSTCLAKHMKGIQIYFRTILAKRSEKIVPYQFSKDLLIADRVRYERLCTSQRLLSTYAFFIRACTHGKV